ncbi:MAG TPA: DNA polymerase Y family protein [Woeseiaceae bacterium]|nr:DNA polymerase Y family protein [Woeseiaceae bacterium]
MQTAGQASLPLADVAPRGDLPATELASTAARRLWFCIHLPQLSLEAFAAHDAALAVLEERQGVHRVLLVNAKAAAAGVMPGQSSSAALALLPELKLELRDRLNEQQVLEALANWLEQFSSFISIKGHDLLLLEIAGSLRLFDGLQNLRRQIATGLEKKGFTAALAIAPTPLGACWLARAGQRVCIREPGNLAARLRGLPLVCLAWPPAIVEALTGMGIASIGDCLRLPREGFARRFGAARLLQLDRALGRMPDPQRSWRATEQFCVEHELPEEQTDRKLLLAVCAGLLQVLETFLLSRQLGTQRLEFSFFHLRAAATTSPLGCVEADRSAERWLDLLTIRIEGLHFKEPVIAIRLEAGATQPLQTASGHLPFNGRGRCVGHYSMTQLAERLTARIGGHSVLGISTVAEHRPQYACTSRNLLANKVNDALSFVRRGFKRPLWMLPEPALLPAEQGCPVHLGRLRLLAGPERLETGWWDEHGIARDYYTAINSRGMRLWVFRNRNVKANWYLHGFFA